MHTLQILALLLGLSTYASCVLTEERLSAESDIMRQLPDCEPFPYNAYSGYLPLTPTKALHYVFVES